MCGTNKFKVNGTNQTIFHTRHSSNRDSQFLGIHFNYMIKELLLNYTLFSCRSSPHSSFIESGAHKEKERNSKASPSVKMDSLANMGNI